MKPAFSPGSTIIGVGGSAAPAHSSRAGGRPASWEDLGDNELDETRRLERQLLAAGRHVVGVVADTALDGHPAVLGHDVETPLEEVVVVLVPEVLEGFDRDDPVDGLVEVLPAL